MASPPPGQVGGPANPGPPPTVHPGDHVEDHGVAAFAPPRLDQDNGIVAEAHFDDGHSEQLELITHPNGDVEVMDWGSEAPASGEGLLPVYQDNKCSDVAYNPYSWKWFGTQNWYFRESSTPGDVPILDAISALRRGTTNITQVNNNCGFVDDISASAQYMGDTVAGADITDADSCTANSDGINAVSFGDLGSTTLGYFCAHFFSGAAKEADIKFNKFDGHKWYAQQPPDCALRSPRPWSIEAVMTHERGHTFGLNHVSETDHGWLTMSPNINGTCQQGEAALGKGDYLGLRSKYWP